MRARLDATEEQRTVVSQPRNVQRGRVLVTRASGQTEELGELLVAAGFDPVCVPAIAIEPLPDVSALDGALRQLSGYHAVVFTSANAAWVVCERAAQRGIGPVEWADKEIVAGPQTAAVLARHGLRATRVPAGFSSEAALAALRDTPLEGKRVLLPRAEDGREVLAYGLRARGARVDEVTVYRTVPVTTSSALVSELQEQKLQAVTFFSPSAVTGFMNALRAASVGKCLLHGIAVACVGETTATAARAAGIEVAVIARETTAAALVDGLRSLLDGAERHEGGVGS